MRFCGGAGQAECVCALPRPGYLNAFPAVRPHAPGCCSRTPCRTPRSSPARAAGRRRGPVGTTVVRASQPGSPCPLVEGLVSIETAGTQLSLPACAAPSRRSAASLAPRLRSAARCPLPPAPGVRPHCHCFLDVCSRRAPACLQGPHRRCRSGRWSGPASSSHRFCELCSEQRRRGRQRCRPHCPSSDREYAGRDSNLAPAGLS